MELEAPQHPWRRWLRDEERDVSRETLLSRAWFVSGAVTERRPLLVSLVSSAPRVERRSVLFKSDLVEISDERSAATSVAERNLASWQRTRQGDHAS